MLLIPEDDSIHLKLAEVCHHTKIIVFIGLPGTGKSLYINHLYHYALQNAYRPKLIQWDVCRKEFEKGKLASIFPSEKGQVHPGVRLSAGYWLLSYLNTWSKTQLNIDKNILLIEAPLVGNRFSELCHIQDNSVLEQYLRSEQIQFVLPVPNDEVRHKIESDRAEQISETAQNWSGAKPSVLHQLWHDTLAIAQELNLTSYDGQAYQAEIYQKTYQYIARHRQTVILDIDKTYDVVITDESALHNLKNELPNQAEILESVTQINKIYSTDQQKDEQVIKWYES
jgi:hypothetical protein